MITIEELTVEVARQRDALKRIEALIWYEPEDYDDLVAGVRVMACERNEAIKRSGEALRERDAARAEAERLRALLPPSAHAGVRNGPGEGSWAVFAEKVVAERDEARAERQQAINEALAVSDACWRMEQEVLQRQLDEWRSRAEYAERELSAAFDLPPSVGPTEGEAKRIVDLLRTERDTARAEVERLRRDLARCREAQRATAEGWRHEVAEIAAIVGAPAHTAELAACVRAEVERLRARVRSVDRSTAYEGSAFERDDELAEIEMLRGVGCREQKVGEPESGPCGACLRCAEERGARWALERHGNPFAEKTLAQYAEEICRDARR